MRFPSQAQKNTEIPFSNNQKILILFSRGCHHKPKTTTEIPFSNRRYWHYFPEVPITSLKKGNPVFKQKILALFSRGSHHKPKKREIPFSNRRYWHYFAEVPITSPKKGKSPFSNRRYWHYFPEKPKKTRKSRFQMRFPSQAQKKHGKSVYKQKILILFSRCSHHKPKKREIPFSNRRYYWHYFPELPITSPKKGKSRFQIEDIGIIFQRFPSQAPKKGNPVFK